MRIALVKLSALGDIIHAMVVLQFIKKNNKKIYIDWIVDEKYKELLEFHPDINKVFVVKLQNAKKKKSIRLFLMELYKTHQLNKYDLVIDMQGLVKSALIARMIPSRTTLGFDKFSIRENIASIFYQKSFRIPYDLNIINRNCRLIKNAIDVEISSEDVEKKLPYLYYKNKYFCADLSTEKKNIILIPGASNESKRYPATHFAELVNTIDANFLIIWGSLNEKVLAEEIKMRSPSAKICKKLTLESLISLISQVDLVIGPDSGPTHMAWAMNVPSITLFGPTPGFRNAFETNINRVIESESIVNPFRIDKNDYSIKNIKTSEIAKLTNQLIRD